MAMLSFGGIDVSKDRLDVMVLPEERRSSVSNDTAGWAELVEQLRGSSIARKMITTLNAMVRDDVVWADRLTARHSVPTAR